MASNSVSIIGTGNMAENLVRAFQKAQIVIDVVNGRNKERLDFFNSEFEVKVSSDLSSVSPDSIVFLCVPDDVVESLSKRFENGYNLIHTSGSVSIDQINSDKRGVFYPLQTMSKNRSIDFSQIPILIESNDSNLEKQLIQIAEVLSSNVQVCDSAKRKKIHLSAVILNNFVTQLTKSSYDFLLQEGVDPKVLNPLLEETVSKIKDIGPEKALTGPAKRGDSETISSHLSMLDGDLKSIYELMSNVILKENGKL